MKSVISSSEFSDFLISEAQLIEDAINGKENPRRGPIFRQLVKNEIKENGAISSFVIVCWPLLMRTKRAMNIVEMICGNVRAYRLTQPQLIARLHIDAKSISYCGGAIVNELRNKAAILVNLFPSRSKTT